MSSQDPLGSTVPPEQPKNPTHFGGDGLYEPGDTPAAAAPAQAAAAPGSLWDFAKRNHVPALLAIGGIAWLLTALVRRSTR